MRLLKFVFLMLMALNVAQVALNYHLMDSLESSQDRVVQLTEKLQEATTAYSSLLKDAESKETELRQKETELREAERKIVSLGSDKKWIYVLGVTEGKGVALKLSVEKRPGDGSVLVDVRNNLFETDLQNAALNSLAAAENLTGAKINDDIVFTMTTPLKGDIVLKGESAGAAMAITIIALIEDREIRENTVITGAITTSGKILSVSQIDSKARAAREAGADTLLVPEGQGRDVEIPGLRIVEVKTLDEALKYILA